MKRKMFFITSILVSLMAQAQLPGQIELPKYKGEKLKYQHEYFKDLLISNDNNIYDRKGIQLKNLNKISGTIELVYIFTDKKAQYSTIDRVKAAIARSGIDKMVYIMQLTESYKHLIGYFNKLDISTVIPDSTQTSITIPKGFKKNRKTRRLSLLTNNLRS